MISAYDRIYLERARTVLGRMLDYAVHDLNHELSEYWEMFLSSPISKRFETGDVSVLAGRSGVELALMVTGKEKNHVRPFFSTERSREYWTGWALARYQWETGLSFSQITRFIPICEIRDMYSRYHEMDIRQFRDRLSELYDERKKQPNLKKIRTAAGLSQSQLAKASGVPLRTIQQYEQGQKDINRARAEVVLALSDALYCNPHRLMELKT